MPEPEFHPLHSPGELTGTHKPAAALVPASDDPPTIRSAPAREPGSSLVDAARPFAPVPLPHPGERLDSYELERPIGVGGMGAVFLAIDTHLQREVALKILPPDQGGDSEVVQRFYQEGRAAARLDHENIARVFALGHDRNFHFIAFEYIEGITLRQKVFQSGGGVLPIGDAINYTLQIAGALVHAAERGVVHRDIKPSNIIITPQGRAKLVDMGLARRFERGHADEGLTQSGMTLGTFDYISPEQARDPRDVDVRGDLYSLGCTLFHMLTGRPPFPDGTVLQKLLQHQEEPPPDVRSLNAAVPGELAAILVKLMAKDRDRRYQTPELLVRDLLTLAGALGLRSLSPEGLVWMSPAPAQRWERHLVWAVPALCLLLIVAGLVWSSQGGDAGLRFNPPAESPISPVNATKPRPNLPAVVAPTPTQIEEAPRPKSRPRELEIRTGDALATALAGEPSGSTLILVNDGPYALRPAAVPPTTRRDLTLKAGGSAHPVVRLARTAGESIDPALLRFGPGEVTIQDVEFLLDTAESDTSLTGIAADGTELTLRRCTFRRPPRLTTIERIVAVAARSSRSNGEDRPPLVTLDACLVEGQILGVWGKGPGDVLARDSMFGPDGPPFWFDNAGAADPVPASLTLKHASIQAGRAPIVRSVGTRLRVRAEDSAIASGRDRGATLVATDDPDRLSWKGRDNLYFGFEAYLQATRDRPGRDPVRGFNAWAEGDEAAREVGSILAEGPVWSESDLSPSRTDPSASFALATSDWPSIEPPGSRKGPFGPVVAGADPVAVAVAARPDGSRRPGMAATGPYPMPMPAMPEVRNPPAMPPAADPEANPIAADIRPGENRPMPMNRDPIESPPATVSPNATAGGEPIRKADEVSVLRTRDDLAEAVARSGGKGGEFRIAGDADLVLSPIVLGGPGRWVFKGDGPGRPRLRFRPTPPDPRRVGERPTLFRLTAGSLELQGIDLILDAAEAPAGGAWGVFAVCTGTDLNLIDCTATIQGPNGPSAVVLVVAGEDDLLNGPLGMDGSAAQVRATNCLIRSGGDAIDVAAGRRLDLMLSQVVLGAGGSLVHGHGLARGESTEPLKLSIDQTTARVAGGLAFLESSADGPDLPVAEVVARDSIFDTTSRDAPLFRVEGQDAVEALNDRIRWDGHGVVYHRIDTYRRDQTAQAGTLPVRFDRTFWQNLVRPKDKTPIHDDARFSAEWPADRPLATLTRDDVRPNLDGPAATAGPDLKRIPPAPNLAPRPVP